MFFVLVKSYLISSVCLQPIMKKSLFLRFLRSLLITDLFDNLESGKRNYCFGKKSWKVLKFISWYLCKGWTVVKKKDQLVIFGSKAAVVKRTPKRIVTIPAPLVPCERRRVGDLESRLQLTPFGNMLLSFLFICH